MTTPIGFPSQNTPVAPSPAGSGNASALTSDFETFLRMLTAQARNQDPLEPLDSSEYAAQLAQFSMVEQQVRTNDMLTGLVASLGSSGLTDLAGWVGLDVRAVAPAQFDGMPVTVAPEPHNDADKAYLVVRNASGDRVDHVEVPVSGQPVDWPGLDDTGTPFASGLYAFSVESYRGETLISEDPVAVYGRVTEAQLKDGGILLTLAGGQTVSSSEVTSVRISG